MNSLKNNIRLYRQRKDWTQKQLGDKLGVSKTAVFYWEKGTREPDIKTIKELCRLFGISPNDLYGSEDEEDTTASDFQETCDWLDLAGFTVELFNEHGSYSIRNADEIEVGLMNEYDLINICKQIVEQGEELKNNFILEKLKLLFQK